MIRIAGPSKTPEHKDALSFHGGALRHPVELVVPSVRSP